MVEEVAAKRVTKADEAAIDLRGVEKLYKGKVHALRGVDLRIDRGEVFGLLGPNGAGKSTLIKILMTVIRPTKCAGHMLGAPVGHKPTLAKIGYLPEHHRFPDYLTGEQVVDFYGSMAGIGRAERRKRTPELLDLVGMLEWRNKKVRSYSKGMRQRVGIAQALINDPEIVLLDEPTDGVDPVGRRDIRRIVERIRDEGRTVLLNSHLLSELEMVCGRVAILVQGRLHQQGTLDELTLDQQYYEIEIEPLPEAGAVGEAVAGRFAPAGSAEHGALPGRVGVIEKQASHRLMLDGGVLVLVSENRLTAMTTEARRVQPLLDAVRASGMTIKRVSPFRPSLEDLFIDAVTDQSTGKTLKPGASS
jgi:ABC-2 type transport system ATP-binding protein